MNFAEGRRTDVADRQPEIRVVQHIEELSRGIGIPSIPSMRMFLNAEKSQFTYPGPCTTLRPSFPNTWTWPRGSGESCWKALLLNHSGAVRGPEFGLPITLGGLLENPEISGACSLQRDVVGVEHCEGSSSSGSRDAVQLPVTQYALPYQL